MKRPARQRPSGPPWLLISLSLVAFLLLVFLFLLLGLGLTEFSVSPFLVPEIKTILNASTRCDAEEFAQRCLALDTPAQVRALVTEEMSARYGAYFIA